VSRDRAPRYSVAVISDSTASRGAPAPVRPSLAELFRAFAAVSLASFGGALPWSRRMIVERKGWMTAQEFNETFALSQCLPGPNTINFSVVFGARCRRRAATS
jgi:chromate transporter